MAHSGIEEETMVSLDVLVINLEEDSAKMATTAAALAQMPGLNVRRFPALIPDREAPRLTFLSKFSPDKTLGIALSHRALATEISRSKSSGSAAPILVLEDDVFPLVPDIRAAVVQWLSSRFRSNEEWDVILLNSAGPGCGVSAGLRPGRLCGSTAAYLLSPSGARKMSGTSISWHADIARNSDAFVVLQGPELFGTRDAEPTGLVLGGRDIAWYAQQPFLKLWAAGRQSRGGSSGSGSGGGGGGGPALTVGVAMLFAVAAAVGLCVAARASAAGHGVGAASLALLSALVLSAIAALPWHVSRDANYIQCSLETMCFVELCGALFAALAMANLYSGYFPSLSAVALLCSCSLCTLVLFWIDERRTQLLPT